MQESCKYGVSLGNSDNPFDYLNLPFTDCLYYVLHRLEREAEFLDIAFCSIEDNKEGTNPHTHILLGFRAISNDYKGLEYLINSILADAVIEDFQLKYLKDESDIKTVFVYLTKEFHLDRINKGFYIIKYSTVHDRIHTRFIDQLQNSPLFDEINGKSTFVSFYDFTFAKERFTGLPKILNKTINLYGYRFNTTESETFLIIYYLSLYFTMKNMFIYKNNLYRKIPGSLISIEVLGNLTYLKDNLIQFMINLTQELKSLSSLNLVKFFIMNMDNILPKILTLGTFIKRQITYNILEFIDGLYFINSDKFLSREEIPQEELKLFEYSYTLRYYPVNFKTLNRKVYNTFWESKLLLQFPTDKNLIEKPTLEKFLGILGNLLFDSDVQTKVNVIFIVGVSNSGKPGLVLDVVKSAFGLQNVGTFSSDTKFLLENTVGKDIIIGDELKYTKSIRSNLLKLFGGEVVGVNRKFLPSESLELTKNIILASNYSKEIDQMLSDKAFLNRLNKFIFDFEINLTAQDFVRFQKELPAVLIRCARVRRKTFFSKRLQRKMNSDFNKFLKSNNRLLGPDFIKLI